MIAALLALPGLCLGQEAGAPVELPAVLAAARADNPEIRAADARVAAMSERPSQEGALPDPMLGVRYHNESFDHLTLGESEFSYVELSLEQDVPFPGKLGFRAEVATREFERESAMRDSTVLMVLAETAARFHELALIQRTSDLLRESRNTLDLIARQAAERYGVGAVAQQDALRAALERDALEERVAMLEQKRVSAEAALDALLGRPAGSAPGRVFAWSEPAPLEPFDQLLGRLRERAPELRAAQEDVQRSEAALGLAERDYFPDFALMGAYMNKDGLLPEWELGVRVTVPLYFWQRQRAAVAEQRQSKRAAGYALERARVGLEARLRELYAIGRSSARLVELYEKNLIPQASLTLRSARASYEVGQVDLLATLTAFNELLEFQIRDAEEKTNLKRARAEIGPLIGETPLGEAVGPTP